MAERPTPQSIAVCALIALHSDPKSSLNSSTNDGDARAVLGRTLEQEVTLEWREGGSVAPLHEWAFTMRIKGCGATIMNGLFQSLNDAATTIEGLMELMSSLQVSLSEGMIDPTSSQGVYLRQVLLGFEELSFESVTMLCQALRDELVMWDTSMQTSAQATDGDGTNAPASHPETSGVWPSSWSTSREQVERLVRKECLVLISDMNGTSATADTKTQDEDKDGGDGYHATEIKIQAYLDNDPEIPLLYFWRYLNCLRHGEKAGAIDSLHAYLDHAMMVHSDILQFSALLLASTHANFGDWHIAEMAVEEAVKVAQQSKDASCVAFALGWLAMLHQRSKGATSGSSLGNGAVLSDSTHVEGEMLQRCVARAMQGNLRTLQSGANMLLARYRLQSMGESSGAADQEFDDAASSTSAAWTSLLDAMTTIPRAHSSASGNQGRQNAGNAAAAAAAAAATNDAIPQMLDRSTAMSAGYSIKHATADLSQQRMMSASLWNDLGNPIMSGISSLTVLESINTLSKNDAIVAIQNLARNALHGCSNDKMGMHRSLQSANPVVGRCVYATAIQTMLTLRERYLLQSSHDESKSENDDAALEEPFYRSILLLLHEWAVRRGDLDDARALQTVLPDYLYPRMGVSCEAYADDIKLQRVHLLISTGSWDEARDILKPMIDATAASGASKHKRADLLLRWSELQLEASSTGMAALKSLLQVLTLSKHDEMDGIHATALSLLARLFLKMGHAKRALALLKSCINQLVQHEHVHYQGEAMLTYAMCYMQLSNPKNDAWMEVTGERGARPSSNQRKRDRLNALSFLRRAQELFEKCQDIHKLKQIHYLQARVCNDLGADKLSQRDAASEKFLQASRYLAQMRTDSILDSLHIGGLQMLVGRKLPIGS